MEDQGQQKSWFARNWGCVVPLGGCLIVIILFLIFLGSVFFGISELITESVPHQDALEKVNQDDYIVDILGTPIEKNGVMDSSINISYQSEDTGSANISIPIKGPKGEARLYAVGTKNNDVWTYTELYVIISETDEQIDLLGYEERTETNQEF